MARTEFRGIYVPLVTPFRHGEVDAEGLRRLVDYLIVGGVTGLVPTGTTGECSTLTHVEHQRVIELTVEYAAGRVPVIAGAGSNDTAETMRMVAGAESVGADGLLLVTPYYNRPNQAGILHHFRTVADHTKLPIILYNIPKRTGVNIEAATMIELSKVPNIVGLKDCCGDLGQTMQIIAETEEFSVLTGDDYLLFVYLCLGGTGGIGTSYHIAPAEFVRLVDLVETGQLAEARALHYRLVGLTHAMFCEPNPAPVKAALNMVGIEVGDPRSPILPASEPCRQRLRAELVKLGLI
jgi:4-hydroxy-tetrahydrodipicolinate synthase